jgi:hypothetical protein
MAFIEVVSLSVLNANRFFEVVFKQVEMNLFELAQFAHIEQADSPQ